MRFHGALVLAMRTFTHDHRLQGAAERFPIPSCAVRGKQSCEIAQAVTCPDGECACMGSGIARHLLMSRQNRGRYIKESMTDPAAEETGAHAEQRKRVLLAGRRFHRPGATARALAQRPPRSRGCLARPSRHRHCPRPRCHGTAAHGRAGSLLRCDAARFASAGWVCRRELRCRGVPAWPRAPAPARRLGHRSRRADDVARGCKGERRPPIHPALGHLRTEALLAFPTSEARFRGGARASG